MLKTIDRRWLALFVLCLGDLMNIQISSVSKRMEPLADAAAAVTVLTGTQLMASGARNIAEALRMVPGVDVARSDARGYAVSVRGFNSTSADKLDVRFQLQIHKFIWTPTQRGV